MSQPGPAAGKSTLPRLPGRILGIDAGGSGTRVILLQSGTVTPRPDGPPMNALLTDGYAAQLRQIIEAADATAAGVGMAGLRQPGPAPSSARRAWSSSPVPARWRPAGAGRARPGRAVTGSCSATRAAPTGSAAPPSAPRCAGKTAWAAPSGSTGPSSRPPARAW